MKTDNKDYRYTVRLTETQNAAVQKLIDEGKVKTPAAALQYITNMFIMLGQK
jgi:hypothetical protein